MAEQHSDFVLVMEGKVLVLLPEHSTAYTSGHYIVYTALTRMVF